MSEPVVGDRYPCWWNSDQDGLATILQVRPYTGRFTRWFTHTIVLDCHQTKSRTVEMAV